MRRFYTIATLLLTLLAIGACNNKPHTLYAISIKEDAVCTSASQEVTISYLVHDNIMFSDTKFSATVDEAWARVIDTSTIGEVVLEVDENEGDTRTATIKISAPGCVSAKAQIVQFGSQPATANHTLMFYFFGTSLNRYFETNIKDAILAIETGILGNSNRVLFFRQESASKGYISELCYDIATKKCIEQRLEEVTLNDKSIITPEKIGEHIAKMADIAPAHRYGIIFAGHGQGWITREIINRDADISQYSLNADYNPWIPAIGAEVTRAFGESNVQVNIDELAEGIECSNVELDYILFDACFMSNIEAIYDLRHSANYIIASPCEIMGKGFPYHRTLPYLFENYGAETDYVGAARSYYKYYESEYVGSSRCGSISVYKCDEIEALAEATKSVMASAKSDYDASKLQTYEGQRTHHFYDFGQWVNTVATDNTALAAFNSQMKMCIIESYTLDSFYSAYGSYGTYPIDKSVYSGVTTSAPSEAYPNGWRQTNWYKKIMALEN